MAGWTLINEMLFAWIALQLPLVVLI